jgi:hypothetical protein
VLLIAGSSIERLCDVAASDPTGYAQLDDRGPMVRAARALLGSVTRVLLLADIVVVKQLLLAKDRVSVTRECHQSTAPHSFSLFPLLLILQISRTLGRLESVATFTEFVKAFSVFGAEMVELAHITGKCLDAFHSHSRAEPRCFPLPLPFLISSPILVTSAPQLLTTNSLAVM